MVTDIRGSQVFLAFLCALLVTFKLADPGNFHTNTVLQRLVKRLVIAELEEQL